MLRAMRARLFPVTALAWAVLCLALFSAAGCAYGEVRQVIRAQFASELNCPEVTLKRRALWYVSDEPDQYMVTGCGVVRTYSCPNVSGLVSYDKPPCTYVNGNADAPKEAVMAPEEGEPDTSGGVAPEPASQPATPPKRRTATQPRSLPRPPRLTPSRPKRNPPPCRPTTTSSGVSTRAVADFARSCAPGSRRSARMLVLRRATYPRDPPAHRASPGEFIAAPQ